MKKNKLNSSRHKVFVSGNYTNDKKNNYFYKRVRKNSFYSVDKQIILRGRRKKNNRRRLMENNFLFLPHVMGVCMSVTWDKSKTTFSRFIKLNNGVCMYMKCPIHIGVGDYFCTNLWTDAYLNKDRFRKSDRLEFRHVGFYMPVKFVELCSICYNFLFTYARSAGTFCKVFLIHFWWRHAYLKLPSNRKLKISSETFIFIGKCSNTAYRKFVVGNAGTAMYRGKKPKVRGVAMNPVDHPNGGRTKTCRPLKNIWGRIAKKNK